MGNLDADISFDADYFEFLLNRLNENPNLGVAGTPFVENATHYNYSFTNIEHVSGACQLFRKECFDAIGGYLPLKVGGIDLVAVITARMRGSLAKSSDFGWWRAVFPLPVSRNIPGARGQSPRQRPQSPW